MGVLGGGANDNMTIFDNIAFSFLLAYHGRQPPIYLVMLKVHSFAPYFPHGIKIYCQRKSLRKHAYSNILKISPLKTESFQIKILIYFFLYFFIFLLKT